ncbi:MAG: phage tail protein [Gluconobacter potus]|uniref:Phage tail protein n=1 Tax=Gluconobacter potus TaxID=2724927 RepID=A0A149QU02_9PROT|nr:MULTISPECIES: hypothetical protein [Gluconobacter]KXV00782.1 phage tail protein [Gluconobacter potus]MBF0865045.1 phage tail protein [Gluconobacter sp. R71656]MBF0868200.1 phage tail protein [Gluconobacter sp. R75628]MBF0874182.1 phage tail protein [Gluconobacter sp. R75629]MBF0883159.1 phage tail protein [Gluconobacter potus]
MIALSHVFGNDLVLNSGTLQTVSGTELTRQSLLRRLLTVPGDYIWQLDYGVGLPLMVGQVIAPEAMESVIRAQVQADAGVDSSQAVTVTVTDEGGGVCRCDVFYVDAASGQQQSLSFSY